MGVYGLHSSNMFVDQTDQTSQLGVWEYKQLKMLQRSGQAWGIHHQEY
jgi:hypothetical protein